MIDKLLAIIKAGSPLIKINTNEYERAIHDIVNGIFTNLRKYDPEIFLYNALIGLQEVTPVESFISLGKAIDRTSNIDSAVRTLLTALRDSIQQEKARISVVIFRNLSLLFADTYRKQFFFDFLYTFFELGPVARTYLIDISPEPLPPEIAPYFVSIDFNLPDEEHIKKVVMDILKTNNVKEEQRTILKSISLLKGLTSAEIMNTVSLSIALKGNMDIDLLKNEKAEMVRKTGLLEWIEDVPVIDEVGGLVNLKRWFERIAFAMKQLQRARAYGLKLPKGCLLCGVPGTGKTLSAKAIASLFELPLFRLDIGRMYSSYVGETEKNVRNVLKIIDALSPCVVLVDEIEKGLAGYQSSGRTDSGVTARLMGSLLYYMQEKKSASFFVCTANDISALPPEFLRKGRFDEIWYVDLPNLNERIDIWKIHLQKVKKSCSDKDIMKLAMNTNGFTGAEIEAIVQETLYRTFYEGREPTLEDYLETIKATTPLSVLEAEKIRLLREWAKARNIKVANATEEKQKSNVKAAKVLH